jgi:hypothetical protein
VDRDAQSGVCVCVCGGVAGWVQMEEAAKTMIRAGCARPRGEFRRSVAGGAGGANFFLLWGGSIVSVIVLLKKS